MATERDEIFLANSIIEEFGIQAMGDLPVDIDMILQAKGFTVIERELPEDLVAILDTTEKGHPLLVTESKLSDREARFTKARELGHYLLSKSFSGIRTDKAAPPVSIMAGTNPLCRRTWGCPDRLRARCHAETVDKKDPPPVLQIMKSTMPIQTRVHGRCKHVYRDGTNTCTETVQTCVPRRYKRKYQDGTKTGADLWMMHW